MADQHPLHWRAVLAEDFVREDHSEMHSLSAALELRREVAGVFLTNDSDHWQGI